MPLHKISLLGCLVIVILSSFLPQAEASDPITAKEPFLTIAKRRITKKQLVTSIAKLMRPVTEPPAFWSQIANNRRYSRFHRRCAVEQLFKRHVHAGMTLLQISRLLNRPTWLRERDIAYISLVLGHIPLQFGSFDDYKFTVDVLPQQKESFLVVFIRMKGKVPESDFKKLLMSSFKDKAPPTTGRAKIAEIAYWPR